MADQPLTARSESRYRMGCAGMFVLGTDAGYDDLDQALVAAGEIKAAFVYGPRGESDKCYGPFEMDEIAAAKARAAMRDAGCTCDQAHCPTDGVHAPACATKHLPEEGVTAPDGSGWSR